MLGNGDISHRMDRPASEEWEDRPWEERRPIVIEYFGGPFDGQREEQGRLHASVPQTFGKLVRWSDVRDRWEGPPGTGYYRAADDAGRREWRASAPWICDACGAEQSETPRSVVLGDAESYWCSCGARLVNLIGFGDRA